MVHPDVHRLDNDVEVGLCVLGTTGFQTRALAGSKQVPQLLNFWGDLLLGDIGRHLKFHLPDGLAVDEVQDGFEHERIAFCPGTAQSCQRFLAGDGPSPEFLYLCSHHLLQFGFTHLLACNDFVPQLQQVRIRRNDGRHATIVKLPGIIHHAIRIDVHGILPPRADHVHIKVVTNGTTVSLPGIKRSPESLLFRGLRISWNRNHGIVSVVYTRRKAECHRHQQQ